MSKHFTDLLLHPEPSGPQNQDDPGRFHTDGAVVTSLGMDTANRNALVEGRTLESDLVALHQAQDRRAPSNRLAPLGVYVREWLENKVLRALHSPEGLMGAGLDDHPEVESAIDFIHQARKEAHND